MLRFYVMQISNISTQRNLLLLVYVYYKLCYWSNLVKHGIVKYHSKQLSIAASFILDSLSQKQNHSAAPSLDGLSSLQLFKSNVHGYPSREDHFQLIVEGSLAVDRELASNSRRHGM